MKKAYPLVFGTHLFIKSAFGNAVLNENYRFFFFSLSELLRLLPATVQAPAGDDGIEDAAMTLDSASDPPQKS